MKILLMGCGVLVAIFLLIVSIGGFQGNFATESASNLAPLFLAEGISSPQITGYDWFSCSRDDWFHTGFTGVKNGQNIKGVVCRGLMFKARTVRYE